MEKLKTAFLWIKKYEDHILAGMFTLIVLISFVNETVYEKAGRFSSLFMFLVFGLLVVAHFDEIVENGDIRFVAVVLTGVIAMINLVIVGSNKGAVLIPSDLALMALVVSYCRLKEKMAMYMAAAGSILTIIWYVDVRWSYNFNMAGLTFMLFMIMGIIFLEFIKESMGYPYLLILQTLMLVTAMIYALLYHSRCAVVGMLVFCAVAVLAPLIRRSRAFFTVLLIISTAGSVLFTILYIIIAGKGVNVSFLYKDLISGRQQIWKELWGAFLEHPLTGTGSSFTLKSFDIFEVHNGFFDILAVHGIIVFFLVFILVLSSVNEMWIASKEKEGSRKISGIALAAIFAMFAASFFENCFITPPYSAFFMYFLMVSKTDG